MPATIKVTLPLCETGERIRCVQYFLETPVEAIVFDCDGTLTCIEGIDFLAKANHVYKEVSELTRIAMYQSGITPALYHQRLQLTQPSFIQIQNLGQAYFEHRTQKIEDVLTAFKQLNKTVYILSAGVQYAVSDFAKRLGVPTQNVFAVDLQFDKSGAYQSFDESSPLIHNTGKATIIENLFKKHARILYVGDALNDCCVMKQVNRFVGYGGACYSTKMAEKCKFYIRANSMLPLLGLSLTQAEFERLATKPDPALLSTGKGDTVAIEVNDWEGG